MENKTILVGGVWMKGISAGILKQSKGARNRVGIGLSYRPARPHRLAESIPGLFKDTVSEWRGRPYLHIKGDIKITLLKKLAI